MQRRSCCIQSAPVAERVWMDDVAHDLFKPEARLVSHDELVHGIAVGDALHGHEHA